MKRFNTLLTGCAVVALLGCSQESKVRDIVTESAGKQLQVETEAEAEKAISNKEILRKNYIHTIVIKSEITVDDVEITGDNAKARAQIKTIPSKVRVALMEIINRLNSAQENNFNVSNAIQLIYTQMQIPPEELTERSVEYTLHKDGDWKIQSPK